jgi:hypothetical protein
MKERDISGVSEVLDNILIVAMISITISIILLYGFPLIDSHQKVIRERNVISQLVYLSEQLSKVSTDVFPVATTKLALSGGSLSISDGTQVDITVRNSSGVVLLQLNESLGAIKYSSSDFSMAIENGGVFGDIVVASPKMYMQDGNLSIALFKIVGRGSAAGGLGGGVANLILKFNSTRSYTFNESGNITIEIRTDYAKSWKQFLTEFGTVEEGQNEVEITIPFNRLTLTEYVVDVRMV